MFENLTGRLHRRHVLGTLQDHLLVCCNRARRSRPPHCLRHTLGHYQPQRCPCLFCDCDRSDGLRDWRVSFHGTLESVRNEADAARRRVCSFKSNIAPLIAEQTSVGSLRVKTLKNGTQVILDPVMSTFILPELDLGLSARCFARTSSFALFDQADQSLLSCTATS